MPQVVVFPKNDLAIATSHGISEDVAVASAFQHRNRYSDIGDLAAARAIAKHFSHFRAAKPKDTTIISDCQWPDWR